MIHAPIKVSSRLSGMAGTSSLRGNTLRLKVTTHIRKKPANQANKVVWSKEKRREIT
jgi:hypothetical protein